MHRVIYNKIRKILPFFLKKKTTGWLKSCQTAPASALSSLENVLFLFSFSSWAHSLFGLFLFLEKQFPSFPSLSILIVSEFVSRKSMDIFLWMNTCLPARRLASNPSLVTSFLCLILVSDSTSSGTAISTCPEKSRFQWNVSLSSHVYPLQVFSLESWCQSALLQTSGMLMVFFMTSPSLWFIFWSLSSLSITKGWSSKKSYNLCKSCISRALGNL